MPGLDTELSTFPMPRPTFNAPYINTRITSKQKRTIYLHGLSLQSEAGFEASFEQFLRDVVMVQNGTKTTQNVII